MHNYYGSLLLQVQAHLYVCPPVHPSITDMLLMKQTTEESPKSTWPTSPVAHKQGQTTKVNVTRRTLAFQNLLNSALVYDLPIPQIPWKSIHHFLSHHAKRQTDKQSWIHNVGCKIQIKKSVSCTTANLNELFAHADNNAVRATVEWPWPHYRWPQPRPHKVGVRSWLSYDVSGRCWPQLCHAVWSGSCQHV